MIIDLSLVTFDNNLFSTDLPDGSTLSLYALEEAIGFDGADVPIDDILLQVTDVEDNPTIVSSVIGVTTKNITITSDYEELAGASLTKDNMSKCRIEVAEDE